jgi:hypothetical protein
VLFVAIHFLVDEQINWDASGWYSVGLYRNGYFYLTNHLDGSGLSRPFQFGPAQVGWICGSIRGKSIATARTAE